MLWNFFTKCIYNLHGIIVKLIYFNLHVHIFHAVSLSEIKFQIKKHLIEWIPKNCSVEKKIFLSSKINASKSFVLVTRVLNPTCISDKLMAESKLM